MGILKLKNSFADLIKVTSLSLSAVALLLLSSSSSVNPKEKKIEIDTIEVHNLILKTMKKEKIPGFALGIVSRDRILYAKSFGFRDVEIHDILSNSDAFHVASISKTFTATAVMQLEDRKLLNLDSPVVRYLDYFKTTTGDYRKITIRHLLAHSSGLPQILANDPRLIQDNSSKAIEESVRNLSDVKLISEPGEKYGYSNYGFILLSDIISKVTHIDYEEYMKRYILDPLEMLNSSFYADGLATDKKVRPYDLIKGKYTVSKFETEVRSMAGPGGLVSSIDDMCVWTMLALNMGKLRDTEILNNSQFHKMLEPQILEYADGKDYEAQRGLGWQLIRNEETNYYGHAGRYFAGGRTFMLIVPSKSVGIVFLSSRIFNTEFDLMMDLESLL